MGLADMLKDLPKACDVGTKKNSKDFKVSWIGYKLHIDVADGGIPISAVLTSASTPCGRRGADRQYHLRRRAQLPSEFLSSA